ncbi:MAG: Ig-like domain-containing protein [Lachnospiraceae bacterium]
MKYLKDVLGASLGRNSISLLKEHFMIHTIKKGMIIMAMSVMTVGGIVQGALLPTMQVEAATKSVKIQLNRTKKNLRPGKKFELIVKDNTGKKISASKLMWSSNNKKVATVSSKGVVKGIKKGKAVITGKLKGTNQKVQCVFTIYNIENSLELSYANLTLTAGDTETIGVDICRLDQVSTDPSWVTFSSSNSSVASIDAKGRVRAKKEGTAKITAKLKKTYKVAVCEVTVKKKEKPATTAKPKVTTTAKPVTTTRQEETVTTKNYRILRVKTTAYCNCRSCCGSWAGGPTASGKMPKEGRTIAVDKNVIPLGTKVEIDGKIYIAEDTGVKGNWIDMYFEKHSDTNKYGVQYKTVKIYKK